jgi:hypothetical protein
MFIYIYIKEWKGMVFIYSIMVAFDLFYIFICHCILTVKIVIKIANYDNVVFIKKKLSDFL